MSSEQSHRKVISVVSLSHSGSTAFSTYLARNSQAVTLGEVRGSIGWRRNVRANDCSGVQCSCGAPVTSCPVWGPYLASERRQTKLPYAERYCELIENEALAATPAIIDTTKVLDAWHALRDLSQDGAIEHYTVFFIKDVRSYAVSMRRRAKRRGEWPRSYLGLCISWYRQNRKLKRALEEAGCRYVSVSYEQFCNDSASTASWLYAVFGIHAEQSADATHHIMHGNGVRQDSRRLTHLHYDFRWARDYRANLAAVLLPHVFFWNRKHVYPLQVTAPRER